MSLFRVRTEPSPMTTLQMPLWKEYSSPWFQPLTVRAPGTSAAAPTFFGPDVNGVPATKPGFDGLMVPAPTMLLLSCAHVPRSPHEVCLLLSSYSRPSHQ